MANWYTFTTTPGANPLLPTNYSNPQPNKPACPGNTRICAILADDNGFGFPDISSEIQSQQTLALQSGNDQSLVALRS